MIRGIMFFLIVWVLVSVSISVFRMMSGAEKWSLFKTVSYAAGTALIASAFVGVMVVVF